MREILLLITIFLGQIAPGSQLLENVTDKLRVDSLAATAENQTECKEGCRSQIIASPTKTILEDYTASAQAVYSIDLESNEILSAKDSDKRLQIASITKLMTAYIILKEEDDLGRVFTVSSLSPQIGDSTMGLAVGDQLTVRSLLDGLLIPSGSDAAQTLAIGNAGSVEAFVAKMNAYAATLNLTNTHFANPVGWDDGNNYSTAKDVAELARILLRNETFSTIVGTKSKTVTTVAGRDILLETTNNLLYMTGYAGIKTGYTYGAGECLVSLYKDGDRQILTTVLGSSARFYETDSIKGWILDHFSW